MRRWLCLGLLAAALAGCSSEPTIEGRTVSEWIGLFRHEDWQTHTRAQDLLARLGLEALPYLQRSLRAPDPAIRRGTVITMRKMGKPASGAIGTLLGLLAREDVDAIRAEILYALLAIAPERPEVQETFRKRLQDRSPQVRAAAQAGLDFMRPPLPLPLEPQKPKASGLVLREALAQKLAGTVFALLAEVERDKMRAAIFWPAFRNGNLLDDDVQGALFRREGENWVAVGEPFKLSVPEGAEILATSLQGTDKQQVIRECGVKAEALAEHLASAATRFHDARQAGKAEEAAAAAETLARAFDYRTVAFSDQLEEMLLKDALLAPPWEINFDAAGKTALATGTVAGKAQHLRLLLAPCGDGLVITAMQPAEDKQP